MLPNKQTVDVIIAGYLSADAAREDYGSVLRSGGYVHGATVVSKDLRGELSVRQTDHMVREGAQGLGTIGFILGLVVPPLVLTTTATGAAIGALFGELLHRASAHKIKEEAGNTIPLGGAGLILVYPKSSGPTVEPAVKRAITTAKGEAEGHHLQAVRGALANAQRALAAGPGL
jgi:uncharacterized membrane protein